MHFAIHSSLTPSWNMNLRPRGRTTMFWPWENKSHRLVRVKRQERSLDPWVPASALEYYFWTCYVWKNTLIWLIYTIWFLLYVFKWKEKNFLKKKINTLLGKKWTKHTKYNFKTTKVKNEKVLKITNNNKKF